MKCLWEVSIPLISGRRYYKRMLLRTLENLGLNPFDFRASLLQTVGHSNPSVLWVSIPLISGRRYYLRVTEGERATTQVSIPLISGLHADAAIRAGKKRLYVSQSL